MSYYPPTDPYHTPHTVTDPAGAVSGLVFGIVSIVFTIPIIGLGLAFIGFTQSRSALDMARANPAYYSTGTAQAGYVCSIIGLILNALASTCVCGYLGLVFMAMLGGAGI